MAQFYFLSVMFNIIAGLVLMYGRDLTVYASDSDSSEETLPSVDTFETEGDDDFASFDEDSNTPATVPAKKKLLEDSSLFNNRIFRLVVGILSIFVAIIKLLSPMKVPFIGDFVPALAGLLGGFALLVEYYEISSDGSSLNETVEAIFIDSRKYLGLICLAAGIIHFLIPYVIFL